MAKVHLIQTGSVRCKLAQLSGNGSYLARTSKILTDPLWSEWLPIYAWVIEQANGVVLVDTGETARVHERGYHPGWHPFFRLATRFRVAPEDELGPQLRNLGIRMGDIRHVILTHLHTDHAGGLRHVVGAKTWVHPGEFNAAQGLMGVLTGYLPHRWPKWWQPDPIQFQDRRVGPFERSADLTGNEEILILPTPGHTAGHVSVLVQSSPAILLAGDTSYTQDQLLAGTVDGVSPSEALHRETTGKIRELAQERPMVYLPTHDPDSPRRLAGSIPVSG